MHQAFRAALRRRLYEFRSKPPLVLPPLQFGLVGPHRAHRCYDASELAHTPRRVLSAHVDLDLCVALAGQACCLRMRWFGIRAGSRCGRRSAADCVEQRTERGLLRVRECGWLHEALQSHRRLRIMCSALKRVESWRNLAFGGERSATAHRRRTRIAQRRAGLASLPRLWINLRSNLAHSKRGNPFQ